MSEKRLRLKDQSKLQMSNDFTERSVYPKIHSFRVCMSFLSVVPLHYPSLESEEAPEIVRYFRNMMNQDENALLFYIDINDYISARNLPHPSKVRATVKQHVLKQLLTTTIQCDDDTLVSVFEQVSFGDSIIKVWLNAKALPYLINAHLASSGFTCPITIELLQPFRSVYTAKLFERMVRFADTGQLFLTPESIIEITGCKTASYGAIKRDVLLKAEKELLKCKMLTEKLTIKETKVGNRVKSVKVHFSLASKILPNKVGFDDVANDDEAQGQLYASQAS